MCNSFAQTKLCITNKTVSISKLDTNQYFINEQISKIKKIDLDKFYNATIIKNCDSIKCRIYQKNNKLANTMYAYILVQFDTCKNIFVYTSNEIDEYIVNKNHFFSHNTLFENTVRYSFIRLIEKGKITLYDKKSLTSKKDFVYLFKKIDEDKFSILSPFATNIKAFEIQTVNNNLKCFVVSTNKLEQKFKLACKTYFSDCPLITNKIMAEFYTIYDFKTIVSEYNQSCK